MIVYIITGFIIGVISMIIAVVLVSDHDKVKHEIPAADITPEQAIIKLQEIKAYYAYKGRTWTAIDMAIRALQEGNDESKGDL